MNYNEYFPGHQIAMPQPLHDGQVTYADGTPSRHRADGARRGDLPRPGRPTRSWSQRKQIGVRVVLFLVFMTGLTYAVKRKVWADVHLTWPVVSGSDQAALTTQPVIGIIGGSGLYDIEGLEDKVWRQVAHALGRRRPTRCCSAGSVACVACSCRATAAGIRCRRRT